jgi:hypothetical protein
MNNHQLTSPRKYTEVIIAQSAKRTGRVCGDYVVVDRTQEATTTIVADGIGTGIKARVAAVMCASRLIELIRLGFSLREACNKLVDTMHEARTSDIPFAAFSVCRVLNNGHATIISYEIPPPILINNRLAAYLPKQHFVSMGLEMVGEVSCVLEFGDGIILVSDGVSQAGLGHQYRLGWGAQGAGDFINGCLAKGNDLKEIPEKILAKVKDISGATYGDDVTCVVLFCREAKTLNVLTGPPGNKANDVKVVREFMTTKGLKVVCGSTTAEMVARTNGAKIIVNEISNAYHKPPSYEIPDIDYATEGAITLNQVYNILEESADKLDRDSSVSELYKIFHSCDTINFTVGTATNPGHESIVFRQMGVFPRDVIVQLLGEKLKKIGKLVSLTYV